LLLRVKLRPGCHAQRRLTGWKPPGASPFRWFSPFRHTLGDLDARYGGADVQGVGTGNWRDPQAARYRMLFPRRMDRGELRAGIRGKQPMVKLCKHQWADFLPKGWPHLFWRAICRLFTFSLG
jgi:hypothetical protein